jgi:hypothetical protein
MIAGFVADRLPLGAVAQEWRLGDVKYSFWGGLKITPAGKTVFADRCDSCGYLEFFAR